MQIINYRQVQHQGETRDVYMFVGPGRSHPVRVVFRHSTFTTLEHGTQPNLHVSAEVLIGKDHVGDPMWSPIVDEAEVGRLAVLALYYAPQLKALAATQATDQPSTSMTSSS